MRNDRMWKRNKIVIIFIGIIIILLSGTRIVGAAKVASVTQEGITFYFDKAYEVGTFANGDYWVLGPIRITSITPAYDGANNGWEVNPLVSGGHGFQSNCKNGGFSSSLVPNLPYTSPSSGIVSVVKTIANDGVAQPCIKTAVVLTIVTETPPGSGATVFRPPYVGTSKPYYYISDIRDELLPSYAPVSSSTSLDYIANRFRKLRLDHKSTSYNRSLRPKDSMENYQPKNSMDIVNAALRFMLNDSYETKKPALIQYLQAGIDKVHAILLGQKWTPADGHETTHILPAAFTATMLDMASMKSFLKAATFFHAKKMFTQTTSGGVYLWGSSGYTESQYWAYIVNGSGNRSMRDPYSYIDGGACGTDYQYITSQSHKGEYLAAYLMPVLQAAWPDYDYNASANYAKRWVNTGTWAQPDPCAPSDGNWSNYGIKYGPDGKGSCIKGSGRFPSKHGSSRDSGQYRSAFVAAMWNAYMGNIIPAGTNTVSPPANVRIQ